MLTFISARKYSDSDWRIGAVLWGDLKLLTAFDEIGKVFGIQGDALKTEMVRNWEGEIYGDTIKFGSQLIADKAIEGCLQPKLTAFILAKSGQKEKTG